MEQQTNTAPQNPARTPPNNLRPPRRWGWQNLGIGLSTCSFIVLLLASYLAYTALATNLQRLAQAHVSSLVSLNEQQQELQQLRSALAAAASNTTRLQQALGEQQQILGQIHNTQKVKDALTIDEAEYLLNLANDTLQIGSNLPLVIGLLQNADHKLQSTNVASLLALRQAIALDSAALQAVPQVDTTGIYLQLVALHKQIDALPLPLLRPTPNAAAATSSAAPHLSWWRQGLHETGAALKNMLVIRYNKAGQLPFITPEQYLYLYQNCHAMLAQAMLALVQQQPQIYQVSLAQAGAWIQQYFLTDAPVTQALLKNIAQLQRQVIKPNLPTLQATMQALHEYNGATQTAALAAFAKTN